jgi:hypothetical protein
MMITQPFESGESKVLGQGLLKSRNVKQPKHTTTSSSSFFVQKPCQQVFCSENVKRINSSRLCKSEFRVALQSEMNFCCWVRAAAKTKKQKKLAGRRAIEAPASKHAKRDGLYSLGEKATAGEIPLVCVGR